MTSVKSDMSGADHLLVRDTSAPGLATPRVMAETMAVFYAFATIAGLLVAVGSELGPLARWIVGAMTLVGLATSAGLLLVGPRAPRRALGTLVGLAVVLISSAVLVPPEPGSAVALAFITAFVVVDACYFFPLPTARAHLVAGVLLTDGALLVRGDVSVFTVLALDVVLLALAIVTRRLAVRASGASTDPLTGLPNRRGFDDTLQQLVRGRETLSVGLLDLDHFKHINDTDGHEAGDRVLLRVAEVDLPPRAVLARHGGDEFALLLPGRNGDEAVIAVWRMCDALAGIGLSCGVAEYRAGESVAQLMRRADGALYAAKAAGRGRVELAAAMSRGHG